MRAGAAYAGARSLVGYDEHDHAVAMVTVWTTGSGDPVSWSRWAFIVITSAGGTAGRSAAASALQELGASHAFVNTPSSNVAAVATYRAAGCDEKAQVRDLRRPPGV